MALGSFVLFLSMGLLGCAGPLVSHGDVYMGRAFVVQSVSAAPDHIPIGIPMKEVRKYQVVAFVVEGECPIPAQISNCHVHTFDLGIAPLQAPDRLLEFQYRGNIYSSADVFVELNDNSTLRTLEVKEPGGPNLFFNFGEMGTGMR